MTPTFIGLALISPLVWVIIGTMMFVINGRKEAGSVAQIALYIILALWGLYIMMGGK